MKELVEKYFKRINIEKISLGTLSYDEKVSYLYKIYFLHVTNFPYHNFELRKISQQHFLYRDHLKLSNFWYLLSPGTGGYCYQLAQLLFHVLQELGYTVARCSARVLNGLPANSKEMLCMPPTHILLVVTLGDKKFLLDPGLGARGPRAPILITESVTNSVQDYDQFRFGKIDQATYLLEKMQQNTWIGLIQTNLVPLEEKALKKLLTQLERFPLPLGIRDNKTVSGKITETGNKIFFWDKQLKKFTFTFETHGKYEKKILNNCEEALDVIKKEFDIHQIETSHLKNYCSEVSAETPQKRWSVGFSIDQKEEDKMMLNLKP